MNRRRDSDELWGLAYRVEHDGFHNWTSDAITIREHSTLMGMIRHSEGCCDRRRVVGEVWRGPERRKH
jgi:hypothetical protein